jgi:hypothetical protein
VVEVEDAIDAIQRAMANAGQTNYRLVLQSYRSPAPPSAETRHDSGSISAVGEIGLMSASADLE